MIKFFRHIRQRLLGQNQFSKYLFYALGEIVLVVIGILLALQINNWNEKQKIDATKQKTMGLIAKELAANQAIIESAFAYHVMVKDTLQTLETPTTEEEAVKSLSFWRGLRIVRMRNAAFQTAVQAGSTKDFDVDLAEALNALYTLQDAYNDFGAAASSSLYQHDFSELRNFRQIATFLNMVMVDAYYFETELQKGFADCLEKLENHSSP
ncbi:DUF6090 family protein [Flagellimonas sp. DF-77]|uniref:DUF6090 family protein n=1 Tax=Flagellimonas algarum TaxID=3230298 RepID=UPI003397E423